MATAPSSHFSIAPAATGYQILMAGKPILLTSIPLDNATWHLRHRTWEDAAWRWCYDADADLPEPSRDSDRLFAGSYLDAY